MDEFAQKNLPDFPLFIENMRLFLENSISGRNMQNISPKYETEDMFRFAEMFVSWESLKWCSKHENLCCLDVSRDNGLA